MTGCKPGTQTTASRRLGLGVLLAIAIVLPAVAADTVAERPRPNFVLIIGDDISIDDFGCYGHPRIRTPNIDRLAARGMRFTNAYLTASQCSPTRCSIITGRYPHNTGACELHTPLPEGQPLFPRELKQAGYYCVQAGKWHLGGYPKVAFDHAYETTDGGPGAEGRWVRCLQERPRDKPFFMWFASTDAHRTWQPDADARPHAPADAVIPPYMADMPGTRDDLRQYYDEIQRLDRHVGLVVDELKRQEVLDNTLIIVMADNGRPFPRCKTWLYDSGIKTPFVVHWPAGIPKADRVCDAFISAIDIAPTLLELAGLRPAPAVQGLSFAALLPEPDRQIRRHAFAEHNWHDQTAHERMVRSGRYVYIRNARPELDNVVLAHRDVPSYQDLFQLREQGRLTAAQADVFRAPRPAEALFDVEADPHQLTNLVDDPAAAEAIETMRKLMDEWQKQTGDTTPATLTGDSFDRKTGEPKYKRRQRPQRGTMPGTETNATGIHHPGPR
ncbi:MAG: sulfatase [Phycisphaerae bacterium]|nr:sulfatase [Phycisphaerae bacterium]